MGAPFPLTPAPAYYTHARGARVNNVFYGGEAVTFALDSSGATGYSVRDWTGAVVVSGAASGTSLTLATPSGGWPFGWYRLYLTGPSSDSVFGPSYGVTNFCVLRANANFPTAPVTGTGNVDTSMAASADRIAGGVFAVPVRWTQHFFGNPADALSEATKLKGQIDADTRYMNYTDSARPREQLVAFDQQTWDSLHLTGGPQDDLYVYVKDGTVDGSTTYVKVDPGTTSGTKITVRSPNATTIVETFDNLAGGGATLMAALNASAYIRAYAYFPGSGPLTTTTATAIGNANFQGVKITVGTIYPSAKWFEGPTNEPEAQLPKSEVAHWMHLFHDAVKQGNASAKVLGPCFVSVKDADLTRNTDYMASGGLTYLDGYSFHSYNSVNGIIAQGRSVLGGFRAGLAANGAGSLPLWQTELGGDFTNVYGVYHPRRARWRLLSVLLHEQHGIPKERNLIFNDTSHGFWAHPSWYFNGSGGPVNPQAVMHRTLAEECWGKPFAAAYSFGAVGDQFYLASRYTGSDGSSVAVLMATTSQPAGKLTFTVTGSISGVFDAWGNALSVGVVNGRLVVPVSDSPVYVRLPAAASLTPYSFNDWPALGASVLSREMASYVGSALVLSDPTMSAALPQTASYTWTAPTTIDRVLVQAGNAYQNNHTLVGFTIDTYDGSTWTTRKTITETTPTSFQFGDDAFGTGCQRDTFWDERWVWDIKLDAPLRVYGVRVRATAASYGGEPDAAAVTTGGQGNAVPALNLYSLSVYANHLAQPRIVVAGVGSG